MTIRKLTTAMFCAAVMMSGCGVKHVIENTAESYYLYEGAMQKAKVTKRTAVSYVATADANYTSETELQEAQKNAATTTVVACDFSARTCETYSLSEGSDTKVGLAVYTYLYDAGNFAVSRSGNNTYTEYKYEDGRLVEINTTEGNEKVAGAAVLSDRSLEYDENGVNTKVTVSDPAAGTIMTYNIEYNEAGRSVRLSGLDANGVVVTVVELTYNDKGLMASKKTTSIKNGVETVSAYTTYTYE